MKPSVCSRVWQVEAVRDRRLRGKDVDASLRHQATCADCAAAARQLAALGHGISRLPESSTDSLTVRRSRQRLMAAMNEAVIAAGHPKSGGRRVFAAALGASVVAAAALLLVQHRAPPRPAEAVQSSVVVRPELGARWTERLNPALDRVDLARGAAVFTVRPHPGRRVVIQLPDGELEDLGTVFEIRVSEQRTEHIAVSAGHVAVSLRGRPEFSLGAGEVWEAAPTAPTPEAESALPVPAPTGAEPRRAGSKAETSPPRSLLHPAKHASVLEGPATVAPEAGSLNAEDDAYLGIVEALRSARYADARSRAKSYLLQFPNGFRRIEVLNIATRTEPDPPGTR